MATTEVNGKLCLDPAYDVKESDVVNFDGQKVSQVKEKIVVMFHKPKRVITTVKDTHGRKTVMDFVPPNIRLTPIGRLDQDTTGLLLLTNDGDLHQYLTHPKNQIIREYDIVIDRVIDSEKIKRITRGLNIGEGEIGKAKVVKQKMIKGRCHVRLVLRQGKKREIRRIFRRLKIKLYKLHRVSFGGVGLNGLKESEFRLLDENEIKQLKIEISSD